MDAENLMDFYPEFEEFESRCRFARCQHISEPDCGVKEALRDGELSGVRYDNYKLIYDELKGRRPEYMKKSRGR